MELPLSFDNNEIRRVSEGVYVDKLHRNRNFLTLARYSYAYFVFVLWCRYAHLLYMIHDVPKATNYFEQAFKIVPEMNVMKKNKLAYANVIATYAYFAEHVLKNNSLAQEMYDLLFELSPDDALGLGNYALFLQRTGNLKVDVERFALSLW